MPSALAEWRVLAGAIDEVDLWGLPGVHTFFGFPGIPRTSPDMPITEMQEALTDALRRGLCSLHDDTAKEDLDPVEATAVVADRSFFDRDRTPRVIYVSITEAGVKLLREHGIGIGLRPVSSQANLLRR